MLPHIVKKNTQEDPKFYLFKSSEAIPQDESKKQKMKTTQKFSVTHSNFSVNKRKNVSWKSSEKFNQHQQINELRYDRNLKNITIKTSLASQIRQIERKIRLCQKKIKDEKRRSLQQKTIDTKKQFQIDIQRFDFLTNPGGKKQYQEEESKPEDVEIIPIEEPKNITPNQNLNFIDKKMEILNQHYAKNLKKKFQRRELFPHKQCRRKTPKLFITQKTNYIEKQGKPKTTQQHMFRVLTKQVTPQQIYPTIPNFTIVKDNVSKNIMAYLVDYKPFIEKTKEEFPRVNQRMEENQQRQFQFQQKQ